MGSIAISHPGQTAGLPTFLNAFLSFKPGVISKILAPSSLYSQPYQIPSSPFCGYLLSCTISHISSKDFTAIQLTEKSVPSLSMQGHDEDPGIVQLALEEIFATIKRSKGRDFLLGLSMLEIYNEVQTLPFVP